MTKAKQEFFCEICKTHQEGYGNNPYPIWTVMEDSRCCDLCNEEVVTPARISIVKVMQLRIRQSEAKATAKATEIVNSAMAFSKKHKKIK